MVELRITGADQLARLGAEFKAAGRGDLRKAMLADMRVEARPLVAAERASALDVLPRSGGLGARIAASNIRSATRLTGSSVGLRITANNKINLRRLNAGSVRHPLFGNRGFWYGQNVRAGWFDKPFHHGVDDLRRRLVATMDRFAAKLGG